MNIQKAYDGICIRSSGHPMYDPLTHNTRLTSLAENFMTESPEQPCDWATLSSVKSVNTAAVPSAKLWLASRWVGFSKWSIVAL